MLRILFALVLTTVFSLATFQSLFSQNAKSDSLTVALYVPGDSVYWYVDNNINSAKFFFHVDTIRISKNVAGITVVPRKLRSSIISTDWLLVRTATSDNGIVSVRFGDNISLRLNPEYEFISKGFKNVKLVIAEGERATAGEFQFGSGVHEFFIDTKKLRVNSFNESSSTKKRYKTELSHRQQSAIYIDSRPNKWIYGGLLLVPGASQIYSQRYLTGLIVGVGTIYSTSRMLNEIDEYNSQIVYLNYLKNRYHRSFEYVEATALGEEISALEPKLADRKRNIQLLAGIAGSLYLAHWISAYSIGRRLEWYSTVNPEKLAGVKFDF